MNSQTAAPHPTHRPGTFDLALATRGNALAAVMMAGALAGAGWMLWQRAWTGAVAVLLCGLLLALATWQWRQTLLVQQALRRLQRQRELWLPLVSHDLRSPPTNILSLLKLHELRSQGQHDPRLHDGIRRQVQRSMRLTDGLMDLLLTESAQLTLARHDLGELAHEAVDRCWPSAQARGVRLSTRVQTPGELGCVCERELLIRALVHVVDNAVRHSLQSETVEIEVSSDGDSGARLCTVRDSSQDMTADEMDRLMQSLQAPKPGATQHPDIGLRVAHAVLLRHGGLLRATAHPAAGRSFELRLPGQGAAPAS